MAKDSAEPPPPGAKLRVIGAGSPHVNGYYRKLYAGRYFFLPILLLLLAHERRGRVGGVGAAWVGRVGERMCQLGCVYTGIQWKCACAPGERERMTARERERERERKRERSRRFAY